ncbi:MAG: hypothetical protein ACRD92_01690 [Nitrosopumilaceae archaeon]
MAADVANLINTSILIGIIVGVFFAGIGIGYVIFTNTYNPIMMMQNTQTWNQTMSKNPQMMNQWMNTMMQDPTTRQQMMSMMVGNNTDSDDSNQSTGSMMGSGNMLSSMMSQVPEDVIVKVLSAQKVSVGKEAEIILSVLDKESEKPMVDAKVIIGIERGSSMSTMDMMGGMFDAENIGSGKYVVRFTPDDSGIYTLHTHVIPSEKSIHSMMDNHMDIGIMAE